MPPRISVLLPCFNHGAFIDDAVGSVLDQTFQDFEIIIVDDGSADGTAEIADELARTYPHVRAVHHPVNRDYGAALQTGFRSATKDLIFYTDGDAQYDPAELAVLWARSPAD